MSYDLNDEKQIMKNIKNMSINEIAKFADIVAKTNSKNLTFLEGQFSADNIDQIMIDIENETSVNKMLNPTSIGNSAIIAIEAPEPYKSKAKLLFDMLISKV